MPRTRLQDSQAVKPLPRGMYDWEYDNFKRHHPQCEPTYKDLAVASGFGPVTPMPLFKIEKHQSPYDVIKQMSQDIQENDEEEVQQPLLPKKRVTFELVEEEKKPEEEKKKQQWPEWWVKVPYCDQEDVSAWRREHLSQCYGATFKQALPFLIKQLGEKVAKCKALKLQQFFAWSKQRSNDNYDHIIRENEDWFKYGPKKRDAKATSKGDLKQTKLLSWLEQNKKPLKELIEAEPFTFPEVRNWTRGKLHTLVDQFSKHVVQLRFDVGQDKIAVLNRIEKVEKDINFRMVNICATMSEKERASEQRLQDLIQEQKEKLSSAFERNMDELQEKFDSFDSNICIQNKEDMKKIVASFRTIIAKNEKKMEEMANQISQLKQNIQTIQNTVSAGTTDLEDVSAEDILNCLSQL